jgi:hypothetical protein
MSHEGIKSILEPFSTHTQPQYKFNTLILNRKISEINCVSRQNFKNEI